MQFIGNILLCKTPDQEVKYSHGILAWVPKTHDTEKFSFRGFVMHPCEFPDPRAQKWLCAIEFNHEFLRDLHSICIRETGKFEFEKMDHIASVHDLSQTKCAWRLDPHGSGYFAGFDANQMIFVGSDDEHVRGVLAGALESYTPENNFSETPEGKIIAKFASTPYLETLPPEAFRDEIGENESGFFKVRDLKSGHLISGYFHDGKLHGFATQVAIDSHKEGQKAGSFEGYFFYGERVYGRIIYPRCHKKYKSYVGSFSKTSKESSQQFRCGHGSVVFSDANIIEGRFNGGQPQGYVMFASPEDVYFGNFMKGNREGMGMLYKSGGHGLVSYQNGEIIEWHNSGDLIQCIAKAKKYAAKAISSPDRLASPPQKPKKAPIRSPAASPQKRLASPAASPADRLNSPAGPIRPTSRSPAASPSGPVRRGPQNRRGPQQLNVSPAWQNRPQIGSKRR